MSDTNLVREFFRTLIGEEGLRVIEGIPDGEITDEELAKITDMKLTSVRKVLYALYEKRIAEYRTERDDESGWITYWWKIDISKVRHIIENDIQHRIEEIRRQLTRERRGMFYQCKCRRITFEEAASLNFWCDLCGSQFEYKDNTKEIKELEEEIASLEQWMRRLRGE